MIGWKCFDKMDGDVPNESKENFAFADQSVEAIESALSRRNFCTFTGLFLIYILKPRLGQKHSSCPQNHFALCLSTAGLSCCKFYFKNDEKMAKSEIK